MYRLASVLVVVASSHSMALGGGGDPYGSVFQLPIDPNNYPYRKLVLNSNYGMYEVYFSLGIVGDGAEFVNHTDIWIKGNLDANKRRVMSRLAERIIQECTKLPYSSVRVESMPYKDSNFISKDLAVRVTNGVVIGKGSGISVDWKSAKNFCVL